MDKGDIFLANFKYRRDGAIHPIIYWESVDNATFKGIMITNSPDYGNVDLSNELYYENNGHNFPTTNFVSVLLLKPVDWLSYPKLISKLSQAGINFLISEGINTLPGMTWKEYLSK